MNTNNKRDQTKSNEQNIFIYKSFEIYEKKSETMELQTNGCEEKENSSILTF